MTRSVDVPVLIVGGGGAGLTASMLLSNLGVRSLLVSRYPGTSEVPKAHLLNQRTMEIFTEVGVAPAILASSTPVENLKGLAWYSGLGGGGPKDGHGRRLAFTEGWGAGHTDPDYIAASACAGANLPLIRLEPILKAYAEQRPPATVRFNHELVHLEQGVDGVTATILDRRSGETYTVRASYLLGADGGRTVGDLVGIKVRGTQIRKMANIYISADLSPYFDDSEMMIRWVFNPERPEHLDWGCSFVANGPDDWGHRSKEWTLTISFDIDDPEASKPERLAKSIREALGTPDLELTVHRVAVWWMETVLADQFRSGRVFLLGDAAHRNPPTGGLGLNTAIHDAYNLCWKLAAVMAGRAGDALLDTYDVERRPVAAVNIETCKKCVANLYKLGPTLGVSPSKSVEENWAALRMFWEDVPGSAERRHAFNEFLAVQSIEYRQHNTHHGYTYESGAIVGDGTPAPVPLDPVRLYEPSTRPGHPLPHAWVERAGERLALRSLVHGGHFALIAGEDGHSWIEAARKISTMHGIPLRAARVGLQNVDLIDARLAWLRNRGITSAGAVLVRPDGYIGFRSAGAVDDPLATLSSVFSRILSTPFD